MPTNNFIQFNSTKNNMMNDSTYSTKASNGIVGGGTIADSTLHNKLFYQLSTFTKAFTEFMNEYNIDATDENLEKLKQNIEDALVQKVVNILKTTSGASNPNTHVNIFKNQVENRILGYISFGDPYDNFIIQFGIAITSLVLNLGSTGGGYTGYYDLAYITFPLAFNYNYSIFSMHIGTLPLGINEYSPEHTLTSTTLETKCYSSGEPSSTISNNWRLMWVAIGW